MRPDSHVPGLYLGELEDHDIDLLVEVLTEKAEDRAGRIPEDPGLVRRLRALAQLFRSCSGVVVSRIAR